MAAFAISHTATITPKVMPDFCEDTYEVELDVLICAPKDENNFRGRSLKIACRIKRNLWPLNVIAETSMKKDVIIAAASNANQTIHANGVK